VPDLWNSGHRAFTVNLTGVGERSQSRKLESSRLPTLRLAAWRATTIHGLLRRQTPQPGRVYDEPLDFDPARVMRWPRTFIDCTAPALATIAAMRQRVRAEAGWHIDEIATGHLPMVSAPQALLTALLGAAR
jgi:hypothetical protein